MGTDDLDRPLAQHSVTVIRYDDHVILGQQFPQQLAKLLVFLLVQRLLVNLVDLEQLLSPGSARRSVS